MNLLEQCRENRNNYQKTIEDQAKNVLNKLIPVIDKELLDCSNLNKQFVKKIVNRYDKNLEEISHEFDMCFNSYVISIRTDFDYNILFKSLEEHYTKEGFAVGVNVSSNEIIISF